MRHAWLNESHMNASSVLTGPWHRTLETLVSSARSRLTLCAPYVSEPGASVVREARRGAPETNCAVLVLTDLSPLAVCAGATDPSAVASLGQAMPNVRTIHLPRLHAKVYAADGACAVVTSGNLTAGGLRANHECGLLVENPKLAGQIEAEIGAYAVLGVEVDRPTLDRVCELAVDARAAYQAQTSSASRESTRRLRAVLKASSDTLVRARLAEGPIHTVFAKTIEYLLRRHGALTTEQMQPMIHQIHPDLCDDSVDRVINGHRFGKKWKHAARTAQRQLKKRGTIALIHGAWTLIV